MEATEPSFSGPHPVNVAGRVWSVPAGARIAHAAKARVVYVLLPSGDLRCLVKDGEVPIPRRLVGSLVDRYFNE